MGRYDLVILGASWVPFLDAGTEEEHTGMPGLILSKKGKIGR